MNKISVLKRNIWKFYRGKMISPKRILGISNFIAQKYCAYSQYLDDGFEKRINVEFASRLNELYCIEALLNNKMKLEHRGNAGLDVWIENIKGWGEFVAATDTVEQLKIFKEEKAFISDENYHLSRLTSVINTKLGKIKKDIEKGLVKKNDPVILFVSSGWLRDHFLLTPQGSESSYLRTVFPLGEVVLYVCPTEGSSEMRRDYKLGIPKKSTSISNDFFLKEENAHISAIVFSFQTILQHFFSPEVVFKSGDDFVIVHNPLARNPIPMGLLESHHEYKCSFANGILSIKDCNA